MNVTKTSPSNLILLFLMPDAHERQRLQKNLPPIKMRHVENVSPIYYPIFPGTDLAAGGVPTGAFQTRKTTRFGGVCYLPGLTTTDNHEGLVGVRQKQRPGSKRTVHPYAQSMLSRAWTYGLWAESVVNRALRCDTRGVHSASARERLKCIQTQK